MVLLVTAKRKTVTHLNDYILRGENAGLKNKWSTLMSYCSSSNIEEEVLIIIPKHLSLIYAPL